MEPTAGVYVAAILAAILLIMSGFASGSEIAFFSLTPKDISEIDAERIPADKSCSVILYSQELLISVMLIGFSFYV